MKRESNEHGGLIFSAQYVHRPLRTLLVLILYLVMANGIFMLLPFVLKLYGIGSIGPVSRHDYWFIGTTLSVLVAIVCLARHVTVRSVIVDDRQLYAPHYLFPSVPLANITSIQADQYRRGLVMIGVRNQPPRYIHCASIRPVTTPAELADKIQAAIELNSVDQAERLVAASRIGVIQAQFPWAAFLFAVLLAALHVFAWWSGSRLTDLDLIAAGSFFAFGPTGAAHWVSSEALRLIDATLLHGSVVHLLSNIVGALAVGAAIEKVLGWRIMFVTFAITAPISILASELATPGLLHLGASGGILGTFGLAFYMQVARPIPLPATMQNLPLWLAIPAAILCLNVLIPGVDWIAHTVGLILGIGISAWAIHRSRDAEGKVQLPVTVGTWVLAPLALLMLAGAIDVAGRLHRLDESARSQAFIDFISGRTAIADRNALIWHRIVVNEKDLSLIHGPSKVSSGSNPSTPTQWTHLPAFTSCTANVAALSTHRFRHCSRLATRRHGNAQSWQRILWHSLMAISRTRLLPNPMQVRSPDPLAGNPCS